ncbi:hypothetical protein JTE90_001906 [Oedothorax gibbosus]|uniref:Cuticle protein n=1 Tax=Oedothorax gibbosus TaxID=931172 RepID=A0AAV6VVF6_9ARAC|nr:hypothetical protein JTE90_001906 [Oedothorax gibbosus]
MSFESKKGNNPQPYQFGYRIKSQHGTQFRTENSDGNGSVKGSYGYTDATGTYREVRYIADHNGFRADVNTNEQGTISMHPANVDLLSNHRQSFATIKKPVIKPKPLVYVSEQKKTSKPWNAAYSDVRFFHFGNHYHEEKNGNMYEDDENSNRETNVDDEEEMHANDNGEEDDSNEQEGNDDRESDVEERTMFHRFGRHGGHE